MMSSPPHLHQIWSINKRVLLVATNLAIMLVAVACAVLSLTEVKKLPYNFNQVQFRPEETFNYFTSTSTAPTTTFYDDDDDYRAAENDEYPIDYPTDYQPVNEEEYKRKRNVDVKPEVELPTTPFDYDYFLLPKRRPARKYQQLPGYVEEVFHLIKKCFNLSLVANFFGMSAAFLGICAAILRSTTFLKISAGCTIVDIIIEMISAGFMFVSYDKMHNRSNFPRFDAITKDVCRDSTVCVQPLILALIGSLGCIVIIMQVASVINSCKIISQNAEISNPHKRMRRLAKRGLPALSHPVQFPVENNLVQSFPSVCSPFADRSPWSPWSPYSAHPHYPAHPFNPMHPAVSNFI